MPTATDTRRALHSTELDAEYAHAWTLDYLSPWDSDEPGRLYVHVRYGTLVPAWNTDVAFLAQAHPDGLLPELLQPGVPQPNAGAARPPFVDLDRQRLQLAHAAAPALLDQQLLHELLTEAVTQYDANLAEFADADDAHSFQREHYTRARLVSSQLAAVYTHPDRDVRATALRLLRHGYSDTPHDLLTLAGSCHTAPATT